MDQDGQSSHGLQGFGRFGGPCCNRISVWMKVPLVVPKRYLFGFLSPTCTRAPGTGSQQVRQRLHEHRCEELRSGIATIKVAQIRGQPWSEARFSESSDCCRFDCYRQSSRAKVLHRAVRNAVEHLSLDPEVLELTRKNWESCSKLLAKNLFEGSLSRQL